MNFLSLILCESLLVRDDVPSLAATQFSSNVANVGIGYNAATSFWERETENRRKKN